MLTGPFLDGIKVLEQIERSGHKAYFVGGCVRDLLLGRQIGDIDIATSASPDHIQALFPKVIPVGIEHGTVIVRHNHTSYEVTTFRLDGAYSDRRHPDHVQFISEIDEDLRRRDFTINALAMDKNGNIIDLFSGKNDLHNKIIRTVGNGYERFMEDPLRIIRALRFSSQLGFTIEQETLAHMKMVRDQIETVAIERITNELTKLFAGAYVTNGINYLKKTSIYKHIPIMVDYPNIIDKIPKSLTPLGSFGEAIALFCYIEPLLSVSEWAKAWKCSNKTKEEAIKLTSAISYFETNGLDQWLVYQLSTLYIQGFVRLINNIFPDKQLTFQDVELINNELSIQSIHDLEIKGGDLIELFPSLNKGSWIRELLRTIEKEVVFNRLANTKTDLKEWIRCNPPVIN